MPLRIYKASASNSKDIAYIETKSFKDPWSQKDIENEFENNPFAVFFLLEDENGAAGYIEAMVTFDSSTICRLAVLPSSRRMGYGRRLLEELTSYLATLEEKPSFLTLEVREDNEAAKGLYEKEGFVQANRKAGYYNDGTDALYLIKAL